MIEARDLRKSYRRKPVLTGISFAARPAEVTLLVGPNGAGKSTTLKILAGLARADGGEVLIAGHSTRSHKLEAQRALSFLPQMPSFHPRFTCAQILAFYARLRGTDPTRCRTVLAAAGLEDVADQTTGTLSGGMRQRLGIALLLLPDAPVLLLDEPGISLDPPWRRKLQELLRAEASRGKTVLITTHLIAEWNNVAHRCLLCRSGVIERELDPANLPGDFDDPAPGVPSSAQILTSHEPRPALA